jgi:hypothetical protein
MNKVLTALAACGTVVLNTSSFGDTLLTANLTHDQETIHTPLTTSTGDRARSRSAPLRSS